MEAGQDRNISMSVTPGRAGDPETILEITYKRAIIYKNFIWKCSPRAKTADIPESLHHV
jgi:hypothetical protein